MIKGQGYDCKWDFISNKKYNFWNLMINPYIIPVMNAIKIEELLQEWQRICPEQDWDEAVVNVSS